MKQYSGKTLFTTVQILDIALNRHPVRYLLNDKDVNTFYRKIIDMLENITEKAKKVMDYFE